MIKKILVAGVFLGGGYFFIKNILPAFSKKSSEFDLKLKDYEAPEFYRGKDSNLYGSGRLKQSITPANKIDRLNQEVGSTRVIPLMGSGNCETPMCMSYGNSRNKIYL